MFGGERIIHTFSDVYNLAGDIHKRPNFLKTTIIDQVLHKSRPTMSEALHSAYVGGPGISLRRVVPYADRIGYYNKVGQSQATIQTSRAVDTNQLTNIMNFRFNLDVRIYDVEISHLDIEWWVFQHLLEFYPDYAYKLFFATYIDDTEEIKVDFYENKEDTEPSETLLFPSPSFTAGLTGSGEFLYVSYGILQDPEILDEQETPTHPVDEFPDMSEYDMLTDTTVTVEFDWNREITILDVYDDGTEDMQYFEQPHKTAGDVRTRTYRKIVNNPVTEGQHNATRETFLSNNTDSFKLVPVVTNEVEDFNGFTRYTETVNYILEPQKLLYTHHTLAEIFHIPTEKVFIYQKGSGDGLFDDLFANAVSGGKYFPFIPVKTDLNPGRSPRQVFIDKNNMGSSSLNGLYDMNRKMFRKMTGKSSSYNDLISLMKTNKDVDKINYAYVIHGASLNSPENAAQRYIYEFFKETSKHSPNLSVEYSNYKIEWDVAQQSRDNWQAWYNAQSDVNHPLFGEPEPGILPFPAPPTLSVRLRSKGALNLDYTVSWNSIDHGSGTGKAKPGMKKGDVRYELGPVTAYKRLGKSSTEDNIFSRILGGLIRAVTYYYQVTVDTWESITIHGISSANVIHKGYGIYLTGEDALKDKEESGLIIPINDAIFRSMGLVQSTQFATANTYLMLNYYKEVKTKWYQSAFFQFILVVAVIAIAAYFAPALIAGLAAGLGGAVAGAIGLSGIAATVFAVAVNAIAAMIVTRIITPAAIKVFGGEIGTIVGAIVSAVVLRGLNNYADGQAFNIMDMFKADSLIRLSTSIAHNLGDFYQKEALKYQDKIVADREEFDRKTAELNQLFAIEFGNRGVIDVLKFLDAQASSEIFLENPDEFFQRTLMTGSDVSELSMGAIGTTIDLDYTLQVR